jgi:hypothetical protein
MRFIGNKVIIYVPGPIEKLKNKIQGIKQLKEESEAPSEPQKKAPAECV